MTFGQDFRARGSRASFYISVVTFDFFFSNSFHYSGISEFQLNNTRIEIFVKIFRRLNMREKRRRYIGRFEILTYLKYLLSTSSLLGSPPQCARTDLNKRFFPKPMTTTG